MQKFIFVCLIFIALSEATIAQFANEGGNSTLESKGFRNFLGNFSLHASSGAGFTFYSHKIEGPGILQKSNGSVYLFDNFFVVKDTLNVGHSNWTNNSSELASIPIADEDFVLGTDTLGVQYTGSAANIPFSIVVSYTYDRYRIGGGFSYEQAFAPKYYPSTEPNNLQPFKPTYTTTSITRYYAYFGGDIFRTYKHTIAVDALVGTYKFSKKNFNTSQIQTKVFFNLGVSFERSLSEYLKVFVRPSAELKTYNLSVIDLNYTVNQAMPAFYLNIGVVLRMPNLRKCPVNKCNTQRNHRHADKIYRSKMHPFWKWQNPNYGQNFTKLVKYRGKNKRKLNPY